MKPIEILIIEDNPGDVRLTQEALKETKIANRLWVAADGVEGMTFLHREGKFNDVPVPDLIFLDLNLPRMNGYEVLAQIKQDDVLKRLPVVVLTTSSSDEDILKSYNLYANCYVTKPLEISQFVKVVQSIEDFWISIVKLPPGN